MKNIYNFRLYLRSIYNKFSQQGIDAIETPVLYWRHKHYLFWGRKTKKQRWYLGIKLIFGFILLLLTSIFGVDFNTAGKKTILLIVFLLEVILLWYNTSEFWKSFFVAIPFIGWIPGLLLFFKNSKTLN